LPDHCFWRKAIATPNAEDVDPVVRAKFQISRTDRVATAGSCFAQHIARHLAGAGFNYFVTETAHPIFPDNIARQYNFGTFSARYGNVYTCRQLLQLLKRAYGLFTPVEDVWVSSDGNFIDPYRPQIQPRGFATEREYRLDREKHFAAVRRIVEQCDVFVFTLGLTEAWVARQDGAVFPVCPGVSGGSFVPGRHQFINLRMSQVLGDMREALDFIRNLNPRVRFLLTVSPVPLVATAEDRHVLVSTTYSKSVLRVVCEELEAQYDDVAYFPSYEIITGNHARGAYFERDLREVTEAGVAHVMRLFMRHYAAAPVDAQAASARTSALDESNSEEFRRRMAEAVGVICDEEALDDRRFLIRNEWHPAGNDRMSSVLTGGWSSPESWGTWGVGSSHQITLTIDSAARWVTVDLDLHAFIWDETEGRQFDVFVDRRPILQLKFTTADNRRTVSLEKLQPADGHDFLTIDIRPREVAVPKDVRPSSIDTRTLGVALHRMRIR
jgi:hypothetical protein